jgi:citrate synthase
MAMNARSASSALRAFRVRLTRFKAMSCDADIQKPLSIRPAVVPAYRNYATSSEPDLKTTFKEVIPVKRELLKKVKALGSKTIGDVKVENTIGGMRYDTGLTWLLWNQS